jgi:hypothetical protein
MRVPLVTGLPLQTVGFISTRSIRLNMAKFTADYLKPNHHMAADFAKTLDREEIRKYFLKYSTLDLLHELEGKSGD